MKSVVCRKSWQVHVGQHWMQHCCPQQRSNSKMWAFVLCCWWPFHKMPFQSRLLLIHDLHSAHNTDKTSTKCISAWDEIQAAQLKSAKVWSNVKCQIKSWKSSAKGYCRISKSNLILPRSCVPWNKCRAEVYFMNYKLAWHLKSTLVRQLKFWNTEIHERRGRSLFY